MFEGRVAVITGASRGIGRAIAETFADAGAAVAVLARKQAELDAAAGGRVNSWLEIGADESITLTIGASEMGQGSFSGLAQILAEVPDAWLESVPGAESPDAVRAAYVAFLAARLASRSWLPGGAA